MLRPRGWWWALGAAGALGALLLLGHGLRDATPRFLTWVEAQGVWAPVVFAGFYAVATVAFFPGSVLSLAAGALFGVPVGIATVLVGATLGASAAFFLARTIARPWIMSRLAHHPRIHAIDIALRDGGVRAVALLRLSPLIPFNALNYVLGTFHVSFRAFVVGCLAMLPGIAVWVQGGSVLRDAVGVATGARPQPGTAELLLLGVGLAATVLVTVWMGRKARNAFQQIAAAEPPISGTGPSRDS